MALLESTHLDWNAVRVLAALDGRHSLSAAARALGADKATVSRALSRLETDLGARLFERRPRGLFPTEAGQRALDTSRTIARSLDDLRGSVSGADARGTVVLTVPPWFATEVLASSLPSFRGSHPNVSLVLASSNALVDVLHRDAEVGLRNVRPRDATLSVRRAGVLASALYASAAYARTNGLPRDLVGVRAHALCAYDRAITFLPALQPIGEQGAPIAVRVSETLSLAAAVEAGLGLGVLPCAVGDRRESLVRVPGFPIAHEDIWVVTPVELRRLARVRAVVDLVVATFASERTRLAGSARRSR
jgi:DNA-binding transcriptional LysR family regulator